MVDMNGAYIFHCLRFILKLTKTLHLSLPSTDIEQPSIILISGYIQHILYSCLPHVVRCRYSFDRVGSRKKRQLSNKAHSHAKPWNRARWKWRLSNHHDRHCPPKNAGPAHLQKAASRACPKLTITTEMPLSRSISRDARAAIETGLAVFRPEMAFAKCLLSDCAKRDASSQKACGEWTQVRASEHHVRDYAHWRHLGDDEQELRNFAIMLSK